MRRGTRPAASELLCGAVTCADDGSQHLAVKDAVVAEALHDVVVIAPVGKRRVLLRDAEIISDSV